MTRFPDADAKGVQDIGRIEFSVNYSWPLQLLTLIPELKVRIF